MLAKQVRLCPTLSSISVFPELVRRLLETLVRAARACVSRFLRILQAGVIRLVSQKVFQAKLVTFFGSKDAAVEFFRVGWQLAWACMN